MKTVTFLDEQFDVPLWANYITHDLDHGGAVIAWEKMPMSDSVIWYCDTVNWMDPGESIVVGRINQYAQIAKI